MTVQPPFLDRDSLRARVIVALSVIVAVSVLTLGFVSVRSFNRAVEPELINRTRLIGTVVRSEVQRALDRGIPLDSLAGLDDYLGTTLRDFEEIEGISLTTAAGRTVARAERLASAAFLAGTGFAQALLFRRATVSLPMLDGNRLVGEIEIATSPRLIQSRLRDVFLDIIVLTLVAILITVELVLAIASGTVSKPLGRVLRLLEERRAGVFLHRIRPGGLGALRRVSARLNDHAIDLAERFRAFPATRKAAIPHTVSAGIAAPAPSRLRLSDVDDIRLAPFLLSVGSEIAVSFLPVYARAAERPDWITARFAAAAPLLLYLVAIAVATPFVGVLVRRLGARRLYLASIPPIVVALAGMGFARSLIELALRRGVIGLAYATATFACQSYAIEASGDGRAGRAVGAAVAVTFGGVFCGSAIGGVLAGRFGFTVTFLAASAIVALSGALALRATAGRAGQPDGAAAARRPSPSGGLAITLRYAALVIGISVPLNAATAVFIWYPTPLMLAEAGHGTAETARVVTLYYLVVGLFAGSVARLTDRQPGPIAVIASGGVASAMALLSLSLWGGFWAIGAAVTGLGVAHTDTCAAIRPRRPHGRRRRAGAPLARAVRAARGDPWSCHNRRGP